MADFIDTLFGAGAGEFWRRTIPLLAVIAVMLSLRRFIKNPKRPDPDPLEGVEFGENGAVKKNEE